MKKNQPSVADIIKSLPDIDNPFERVWVLDLDGTLMDTLLLYLAPIARACKIIMQELGNKSPSENMIRMRHNALDRAMINEINPETGHPYKLCKGRFPLSLARIYRVLCEEAKIPPKKVIENQLRRIGMTTFDKRQYPSKVKPFVSLLLRQLRKRGDRIFIVTKGDETVQGDKRDAFCKLGLLEYVDAFLIPEDDKTPYFRAIKQKYGARARYYSVGDTYDDDIVPSLKSGYFGIYIPSQGNWKELGKLTEINKRRSKKRTVRYRHLSDILRKLHYLQ